MNFLRTTPRPRTADDVDDLLGTAEPVYPPEIFNMDLRNVSRGVSITWLMQAFEMDRNTVKKRLADCPPIKMGAGQQPLFKLSQAAAYLVKPRFDTKTYIKNMNINDLPPFLRKEVWEARLKEQRWKEKAGDLWHTADVTETFAEVFKLIKNQMQLWVDNLARVEALTDAQNRHFIGAVDQLQQDLHHELIELPKQRKTTSQLADVEDDD